MMPKTLEMEELVLNIIYDYLSENKTFEMAQIVPYIISRFSKISVDLNGNGVKEVLKSLIKKNFVAEGSKLAKKDVLLNPKRVMIYNYINENPGVLFNHIVNNLYLSNYVVHWHVQILERFNFIIKDKIFNRDVYFNSSLDMMDVKMIFLNSVEKSKKIIEYLKINDIGVTKTKLTSELKMHPNTINKYLSELEALNIVVKEKKSRKILYFYDEQSSMMNDLINVK